MKKTFLIIIVLVAGFIPLCAELDIIKPELRMHFKAPFDSTIRSISIIKSEDTDSGTVYFNYYTNEITDGSIQNPTCVIENGAGWLGRFVFFSKNDTQKFLNRANNFIHFNKNAARGEYWRLTDLQSGNYIIATVTAVNFSEILPGLKDSVKTIELKVVNSQNKLTASPLNGKKFLLSENYGLIELFDMYYFPDSLISIKLAGIENIAGLKPVTFKDVFDFDIGDVFHIYEGDTSVTSYGVLKRRRITVVGKTYFESEQVVDYEVKHEIMEVHFYNNDYDTSYSDNFVHLRYDLKKYKDYLPEQSYLTYPRREDTMLTMNKFFYGEFGGRQVIRTWKLYERFIPPCYVPTQRIGVKYYYYIEGCGDFFDQDYGYQQVWRRLMYFNKNGSEWGEKLDFVVGVDEKNISAHYLKIINELLINDRILKIDAEKDGRYKIKIYDINGKKVLERTIYFNRGVNEIPLVHLQDGFYFIRISGNGSLLHGKFVLTE